MEDRTNINEKKEKYASASGSQTVDRALMLLKMIAASYEPITIPQICEQTGFNRTTVWRLLYSLENSGFVERDEKSKGYQIGYAATSLSTGAHQQYGPLIRAARPVMERLWQDTQETVILSVPKHHGILCIDQIDSPHSVRLKNYIGDLSPFHCTSNGKVWLAHLSEKELDEVLSSPLPAVTPNTITDPVSLREEVAQVRKSGYGSIYGELDGSENGISVPVYSNDEVIAFINVSGPVFRFTKEKLEALAPTLRTAGMEISEYLH